LFTGVVTKKYDRHEIYDFYDLLSLLGKLNPSPKMELMVTEIGRTEVGQFFRKKKEKSKLVVFHPGCGSDGTPREWPLTSYAVLGNWILLNFDVKLVLTSGPEERKKTMDLNRLLNGRAMDLGGKLSWDGLIALVDESDLVVSGNTGVMHVAAALGKKQVALHGPTNPKIWGPLNSRAKVVSSPCPQCPCLKLGFEYHDRTSSCMDKISTEEVKSVISSLFDKP
jgi:ADP-heptose:LPS heptosyltransferase